MTEQLNLFDRVQAFQAAVDGMERAERAERVQLWKTAASIWLDSALPGSEFTADDLVRAIGLPDSGPARNNVVGAIFSSAARRRILVFTGRFRHSERVIGHRNLQRVWRKL